MYTILCIVQFLIVLALNNCTGHHDAKVGRVRVGGGGGGTVLCLCASFSTHSCRTQCETIIRSIIVKSNKATSK